MSTIANLLVQIKGDVNHLKKALADGRSGVNNFEKSSISSFAKIAAALAAAFSIRAAINSINETANAIDHLNDVARALQIPTGDIQEFAFAAKTSGSSIDDLGRSMKILTGNIGDASLGSNDVSNSLRRLGLNLSFLKQLNPGEQFEMVASALNGVVNDSERASLAIKLFGRDGVNVVNNIAGSLDDQRRVFRGLGVALTDSQVQAVASFNDSKDALEAIFSGIKQQTVAAIAPAFKAFIDNIIETVKQYGGIKKIAEEVSKFIVSTITTIINFFRQWKESGEGLFDNVVSYFPKFKEFVDLLKEVGTNLSGIYSSAVALTTDVFEQLAPIIAKIKQAFTDLKPIITDLISDITAGFTAFSAQLDGIISRFTNLLGIGKQFTVLKDALGFGEAENLQVGNSVLSGSISNRLGNSSGAGVGETLNQSISSQSQPAQVTVNISGDVGDFLSAAVTSPTFSEAVTSLTDRIMQDTSRIVGR